MFNFSCCLPRRKYKKCWYIYQYRIIFLNYDFFIFLQLKTHSMLNSINTVEERLRNAADYNIGGDNNW